MSHNFLPGNWATEIATGVLWKVLYNDTRFKMATCERSEGGLNIVRAIRDDELGMPNDEASETFGTP